MRVEDRMRHERTAAPQRGRQILGAMQRQHAFRQLEQIRVWRRPIQSRREHTQDVEHVFGRHRLVERGQLVVRSSG